MGEFTRYCKASTRMVEETGVYCLFMPEVLPPIFYKRVSASIDSVRITGSHTTVCE